MTDLDLIRLGWLFFTVLIVIVAALSLKAFGPDVLHEFASDRQKARSIKRSAETILS
jgi:hypothetical protein